MNNEDNEMHENIITNLEDQAIDLQGQIFDLVEIINFMEERSIFSIILSRVKGEKRGIEYPKDTEYYLQKIKELKIEMNKF